MGLYKSAAPVPKQKCDKAQHDGQNTIRPCKINGDVGTDMMRWSKVSKYQKPRKRISMSLNISWQDAVRSVFDELRDERSIYGNLCSLEALWVIRQFYFRIRIIRRTSIRKCRSDQRDHLLSLTAEKRTCHSTQRNVSFPEIATSTHNHARSPRDRTVR